MILEANENHMLLQVGCPRSFTDPVSGSITGYCIFAKLPGIAGPSEFKHGLQQHFSTRKQRIS